MDSSNTRRVLIAGINQFINTVISYINIGTRDLTSLLGGRDATSFFPEEGRITYALIVEGLLASHLKYVNVESEVSNYRTADSVAEHLFKTTNLLMKDNQIPIWTEAFKMMEFYGISLSEVDPRTDHSDFSLVSERYTRPAALKIVFAYIAMTSLEFRMATRAN